MTKDYGRSLSTIKAMFYSHKNEYKYFKDINPEDIERIRKFAEEKRNNAKQTRTSTGIEDPGALYKQTITALIEPGINRVLRSFDEKIFFLINVADPELKANELIKHSVIMPMSVIDTIDNPKSKAGALDLRKKQLARLKDKITTALGFYDAELIQYESYYRTMFVCDEEMLAAAQMNV